ncbi:hypothetical protein Pint_19978 [Pistacia integerrima]|uniref:Uncharacterized protein n=1 Tax=Pistacia integerrima TaxID=434235 RepID=A0ACC0XC11_9ROSI|nr:hypothetical protein Pint_19978 [Pistacia integerrima]
MANQELDPVAPPGLHLVSAFLAMEPADSLISLARACGGGSVTEKVQRFIWSYCISEASFYTIKESQHQLPPGIRLPFSRRMKIKIDLKRMSGKGYVPYVKNFLKKLIVEVESNHGDVLDELYEQYAYIMTSLKDDHLAEKNKRVCKYVTFLFPDGTFDLPSCPKSRKLIVPLQCSLNMLEGDTGLAQGSVWLECALSKQKLQRSMWSIMDWILLKLVASIVYAPKVMKLASDDYTVRELLCGQIRVKHVILTDGDLSTLVNLRSNLELNQLSIETDFSENEDSNVVKCIHLPWESASESEVHDFMPEIVLGADVIYDPTCLPHLVRVLSILLNQKKSDSPTQKESCKGSIRDSEYGHDRVNDTNQGKILCANDLDRCHSNHNGIDACKEVPNTRSSEGPVAYIASVIRNIDTFNCFLALASQANLAITDITETFRPFNLLPYMQSYQRSNIRLFIVSCNT